MYTDALFVAEWITPETTYQLSDAISAFEILSGENGLERLGPVCTLPEGAYLEACGDGFNDRTIKIRCADRCYFVFLQDLDLQRPIV